MDYTNDMELILDSSSDEPLFEQIVSLIRWRISVATLRPGEALPSTRAAADRWAVNRHTVARAYRSLVDSGLLERGPRGQVLVSAVGSRTRARDEVAATLISEVTQKARRLGVSIDRLIRGLEAEAVRGRVTIVECTADQCADLRSQVERSWAVDAEEYLLSESGEPPAGPFVATLSHYEEIRRRWPSRRDDVHFVAAGPSPSLGPVLSHLCARSSPSRLTVVVDHDLVAGQEIARELCKLASLSTAAVDVRTRPDAELALAEAVGGRRVIIATPHVHRTLSSEARESAFVIRLRYEADADSLESLAAELSWRKLPPAPTVEEPLE